MKYVFQFFHDVYIQTICEVYGQIFIKSTFWIFC